MKISSTENIFPLIGCSQRISLKVFLQGTLNNVNVMPSNMILQLMQKPSAYGCSLNQPSIKPKGMTFKGSNLIIITFLWMTQTSFPFFVQEESQRRDHLAQGITQNIPQLKNKIDLTVILLALFCVYVCILYLSYISELKYSILQYFSATKMNLCSIVYAIINKNDCDLDPQKQPVIQHTKLQMY